jgi:hypothetical protein
MKEAIEFIQQGGGGNDQILYCSSSSAFDSLSIFPL